MAQTEPKDYCNSIEDCDQIFLGNCDGCPFVKEALDQVDEPVWTPGPRPEDEIALVFEAMLQQNVDHWHYQSENHLYQWVQDAASDLFEDWLLPADEAVEEAYELFSDKCYGPYTIVCFEYDEWIMTVKRHSSGRMKEAMVRNPAGALVGHWYVLGITVGLAKARLDAGLSANAGLELSAGAS